jgi:death-on-curing protein
MKYLTAEQVLFIHARLVTETGGSHGLRELGLLESAVARPRATFDGTQLHPDLFTKAAALMDSLVNNHPFVDGNKRTGITAAGLFLRINGWRLTASLEELQACTLGVAMGKMKISQLAAWLSNNSMKEDLTGS